MRYLSRKKKSTFKECMCFEAFPLSYFLMSRDRTPGASEGETGVYGRMMGLPFLSSRASGSELLTIIHDVIGKRDGSPLGISNTKL